MTIEIVNDNARKRVFEIVTSTGAYEFSYAKLRVAPSANDPVVEVFPDPELGGEAFTYRLKSGIEDTVHIDAVLDAAQDPDYLQELLIHRLTVEARAGLEASDLGKRHLARQLGTSPSQLYRLLDPGNTSKSVGQLLALLHHLDRDVDVVVRPKPTTSLSEARFEIFKDSSDEYRFRLKYVDGSTVLTSDGYSSRGAARKGIESVKNSSGNSALFAYESLRNGAYRFWLKAKNHHVLAESPPFRSQTEVTRAIAAVQRAAPKASVEESESV